MICSFMLCDANKLATNIQQHPLGVQAGQRKRNLACAISSLNLLPRCVSLVVVVDFLIC